MQLTKLKTKSSIYELNIEQTNRETFFMYCTIHEKFPFFGFSFTYDGLNYQSEGVISSTIRNVNFGETRDSFRIQFKGLLIK